MTRPCSTCQHLKRPEIDRRLAAGEPVAQVARDYDLNLSSLHRHRTNCLKLGSSNQIKKEAARGSAAVALLPSKENLGGAYADLQRRIDQIVTQAQQQGSLNVAISGLNSIRQTLDSLARLAGHLQPASTQVNVAVQTNVNVGAMQIAERLIQKFDHEPELKARIAQALLEVDHEHSIVKLLIDFNPALWMQKVLGIPPHDWQKTFLLAPRGASIAVLTARQVGKTTAAAVGMAHSAVFMPGSLSVIACPTQNQSAEALRKVRDMVLMAGAKLTTDNVYRLELANGSRVLALPGTRRVDPGSHCRCLDRCR